MIDYILDLIQPLKGVISDCCYDRIIYTLVCGFELIGFLGIIFAFCWTIRSFFGGRFK